MISKIKQAKNLGIFHDYNHQKDVPDFKRYNLIYGWNGSGKTTLSRLFSTLPSGSSDRYPDLEYRIDTEDGSLTHKKGYSRKVMVFNHEYVAENAPILENTDASAKHIFILGEEDKKLVSQIEVDKTRKAQLSDSLNKDDRKEGTVSLLTQKKTAATAKNDLFTNIAKTIGASRGGTAIREYRKPNAEKAYERLSEKATITPEQVEEYESRLRESVLDKIGKIALGKISITENDKSGEYDPLDLLEKTVNSSNTVLKRTAKQELIARLEKNPDIAEWVAVGIQVHKKHKSGDCEYCQQVIPQERAEALARHFNEAYEEIIADTNLLMAQLENVAQSLKALSLIDKANFYKQLRSEYEGIRKSLEGKREVIQSSISSLFEKLEDKKTKTHQTFQTMDQIDFSGFSDELQKLNSLIDSHNDITDNFSKSAEEAKTELEKHYVSSIYDDAKSHEQTIEDITKQVSDTEKQIDDLEKTISENESRLRNSKIACDRINKLLKELLGGDEIVFEDIEFGYAIKRNGVIAKDLSEGEKTIISFAYFLVHLQSKDFKLKEGVVVIDDPISSLDVDYVYRVSSLIQTKLRGSRQLFVLTHNYEFFQQLRRWFLNELNGRSVEEKDYSGEFIMIKNSFDTKRKRRTAYLGRLDPLLKDYDSEYHYLFKKLLTYKDDVVETERNTIEAIYPYPNFARKVMECFLAFRVPKRGSMQTLLREMKSLNKDISGAELVDVYSFINSQSHLDSRTGLIQFDPTLTKNGEQYITKTLELIRKCDEKHYAAMTKLVESVS